MALKAAPPPTFAGSGRGQRVILVSAVAAIGGFLFGYDTAVINGAVDAIKAQFGASDLFLGLTVASALIGSAVGAWIAGPIADRAGRIRVMLLASGLFAVSSLATGIAGSLGLVAGWRFIGGVAIGIASVIAPTYIAEVAPAHMRGRLGSLQQLAIVVGIFVALLVDFAIADIAGGASKVFELGFAAWRWMFWAAALPSVLYGVLALLIPESPRYLVARGRETEAAEVIHDIIGGDPQAKVAEIRQTVATERHPRLRDLRGPRFGLLPVVWIGIGLSMFQQLVGINVIFYYSSTLWRAVGFTERSSLVITVITSVTNIVTTFIAIGLIDRIGRRPLLLLGSAGMTVSLGTMALVFGTAHVGPNGPELGALGPVALVAANLFVVFFGFSWGPVVWVLLGEMFPNKIRAVALSVAASAQWLTNYLVTATFPSLKSISLGLAYGIYTVSALLSLLFVASLVRDNQRRVAGSKGFVRASEEVFPGSRASESDAKRGAGGAPNVPDRTCQGGGTRGSRLPVKAKRSEPAEEGSAVGVKRVHHIGVAVADLARGKELLGEKLGLPLVREHRAPEGNPAVAFFRCGEVEIELLEHSRPEDREVWLGGDNLGRIEHIAIEVDDLATTLAALEALGITSEPPRAGPLGVSARTHPPTTTGIVLQLLQAQ